MSTLAHYAPAGKSTLRLVTGPTEGIDTWELVVGLPALDSPQAALDYGYANGLEVLTPAIPDTTPMDLIDWVHKGYDLGLADYRARIDAEAAAAIEEASPTDADVAEGIAPWAVRPTPEALAAGLRAILARIDDEGAAGELARAALEAAACDVELFRATSWREVQAREWEMAETAFTCPACSREVV